MQTLKLISIYYHVCDKYNKDLCQHVLRLGTNRLEGRISDEEIITIYLFCTAYAQKYTVKAMYDHIDRYWRSWFPDLPSYQSFNARLNRISEAFPHLVSSLCDGLNTSISGNTVGFVNNGNPELNTLGNIERYLQQSDPDKKCWTKSSSCRAPTPAKQSSRNGRMKRCKTTDGCWVKLKLFTRAMRCRR